MTKERVEKLLKQVGDVESEIDTLLKLTKEDLWKRDLDDFIAEWRFQLADEAKLQKKMNNMTRRASTKLKIAGGGIAGRKRKGADSDDSEFETIKAKKAPKNPKPVGGLLSYLAPPAKTKVTNNPKAPSTTAMAAQRTLDLLEPPKKESVDDVWMNLDGSADDVRKVTKAKKVAPLKAAVTKKQAVSDDKDEDEVVRPTATRQPRAAAAKPVKYNTLDSDSDGEDMLFDVGKMVKGIETASVDNSRQLFAASASRPSSSSGLPKKPVSSKQPFDIDADDTNYSMLAPPTTSRGPAITAPKTILSDDDDEDDSIADILPPPKATKPKPAAAKTAPKPRAPPKRATKAPSQPPEAKKSVLSPVGKAYAAMRAKQATKKEEDEVEQMADKLMDDDEEDQDEDEAPPAARRPGRRAAAAPKKWVISDDEDEDEDEDEGMTADFDDGSDE